MGKDERPVRWFEIKEITLLYQNSEVKPAFANNTNALTALYCGCSTVLGLCGYRTDFKNFQKSHVLQVHELWVACPEGTWIMSQKIAHPTSKNKWLFLAEVVSSTGILLYGKRRTFRDFCRKPARTVVPKGTFTAGWRFSAVSAVNLPVR